MTICYMLGVQRHAAGDGESGEANRVIGSAVATAAAALSIISSAE